MLWAVPAAIDWYKWRAIQAEVTGIMAHITASPYKPYIFVGMTTRDEYCLANVEVKWDSKNATANPLSFVPRADAVYLAVPEKVGSWTRSPSEVIRLLRQASSTN